MKDLSNYLLSFSIIILSMLVSCGRTASLDTGNNESWFDTNEYKKDLLILSSDSMEGRMPGTTGGIKAANYIASRFTQFGLIPISDDQGYFQKVSIESFQPDYTTATISITGKNFEENISPYNEMLLLSRVDRDSVDIEGDLVYAGYGVVAPEYNWDDYKAVDVSGKNYVDFKSLISFSVPGSGWLSPPSKSTRVRLMKVA